MATDPLQHERAELYRSPLAPVLIAFYKLLKGQRRWSIARVIFAVLTRLEGGKFRTASVRSLLSRYHGVEVGAYSYGDCLIPGAFPPGVTVGRYTSVAAGVRVYNQNHPLDHLSTHPFFYERGLGVVTDNDLPRGHLVIGHDVWMGRNAIVTPGCRRVGNGAVIGAGAVVTRDVDDFAIVAGNPARVLRYRFPESTRRLILETRWWERTLEECKAVAADMTNALGDDPGRHALLSAAARAAQTLQQGPAAAGEVREGRSYADVGHHPSP